MQTQLSQAIQLKTQSARLHAYIQEIADKKKA
jgi:hypothetical protein